MKIHFTDAKFDAFKYAKLNGKTYEAAWERYKDKYFFDKIARIPDLEQFYLANFVERDVRYPLDLLDSAAEDAYKAWLRRKESLTYIVTNEVRKLEEDFHLYFKCHNGQRPELLKLVQQKKISIETLAILNSVLNFFPSWDDRITDAIVWPDIRHKVLKYEPFLVYDKTKIKNLIMDVVRADNAHNSH